MPRSTTTRWSVQKICRPFKRATSRSRSAISRVSDTISSSRRFFSLCAKAMYVDRILDPVFRNLRSASRLARCAAPTSTQRSGHTPAGSSEPSQHSGSGPHSSKQGSLRVTKSQNYRIDRHAPSCSISAHQCGLCWHSRMCPARKHLCLLDFPQINY